MKGKTDEGLPRSACDCYERVAAWQPSDGGSQDIFKQLRLNLNHYERRYNQSKEKDTAPPTKPVRTPKTPSMPPEEKENCMKLPIIPSLPLKLVKSNREPFAIKSRNILEDVLKPCLDTANDKSQQRKCIRLTKIRKVRCQQPLNPMGPEFRLDFQRNMESVDKQPLQTDRTLKRLLGSRPTSHLEDYNFSDACFLPHSRPSKVLSMADCHQ